MPPITGIFDHEGSVGPAPPIKRQSARPVQTSLQHGAVMDSPSGRGNNPSAFPDCGRYLGACVRLGNRGASAPDPAGVRRQQALRLKAPWAIPSGWDHQGIDPLQLLSRLGASVPCGFLVDCSCRGLPLGGLPGFGHRPLDPIAQAVTTA